MSGSVIVCATASRRAPTSRIGSGSGVVVGCGSRGKVESRSYIDSDDTRRTFRTRHRLAIIRLSMWIERIELPVPHSTACMLLISLARLVTLCLFYLLVSRRYSVAAIASRAIG